MPTSIGLHEVTTYVCIKDPSVSQYPGRWHNGSALVFCMAVMPAKRSAGVAPEVDLRECTLHSALQKAELTLALKSRGPPE